MSFAFENWSGSLQFTAAERATPRTEQEVAEMVVRAGADGRTVRTVGAGHSSSALVRTDDLLLSPEHLTGLVDHSGDVVTLRAGTLLGDVGPALHDVGLALLNYGDVDMQSVGGSIGTGTHGTGHELGSLSSTVLGGRLVTGTGQVCELGGDDPDLLHAAQVSLGALGVFTEVRMRVRSAFRLHRREWCVPADDCLHHLDELTARNRNIDFYWHPRRDEAQIRTHNEPGEDPEDLFAALPAADGLRRDDEGWSFEIIPQQRGLKFEEMEYMLPAEAFADCFAEVRARIKERHRKDVAWRVLCRSIAGDDGDLSPFHGRPTMTIALLQNTTLPVQHYHSDLEPVLRAHGGRPHWGKKHSLEAPQLRPLYERWDHFAQVRERLDPGDVFLSDDLRALLVEAS